MSKCKGQRRSGEGQSEGETRSDCQNEDDGNGCCDARWRGPEDSGADAAPSGARHILLRNDASSAADPAAGASSASWRERFKEGAPSSGSISADIARFKEGASGSGNVSESESDSSTSATSTS